MPFQIRNNLSIHADKVVGGLELFTQLIHKNIDGIVPVEISEEERKSRKAKNVIDFGIWEHKPDVIFSNYSGATYTTNLLKHGVPVVWVWHYMADGQIAHINAVQHMEEFTNRGGHLYFVSERQLESFNKISRRVVGHDIQRVAGFIRPAFTEQVAVSPEVTWDAVTVGRTDNTKNPFWLHQKLKDSTLTSAVITNKGDVVDNPANQKYRTDNEHWQHPQQVFRGLPHLDGMNEMSKGKVFVSTSPLETFGITALESMARGLPTLLVTDKSETHASTIISDSNKDYQLINKKAKPEEVVEIITDMGKETMADRTERATRIQEKHSKAKWVNDFTELFGKLK